MRSRAAAFASEPPMKKMDPGAETSAATDEQRGGDDASDRKSGK